jgi:hypothetical protein
VQGVLLGLTVVAEDGIVLQWGGEVLSGTAAADSTPASRGVLSRPPSIILPRDSPFVDQHVPIAAPYSPRSPRAASALSGPLLESAMRSATAQSPRSGTHTARIPSGRMSLPSRVRTQGGDGLQRSASSWSAWEGSISRPQSRATDPLPAATARSFGASSRRGSPVRAEPVRPVTAAVALAHWAPPPQLPSIGDTLRQVAVARQMDDWQRAYVSEGLRRSRYVVRCGGVALLSTHRDSRCQNDFIRGTRVLAADGGHGSGRRAGPRARGRVERAVVAHVVAAVAV